MTQLKPVISGTQTQSIRCLFYGPGGVGKSTLAADMPRPIFLDIEGGTQMLPVDRYPIGSLLEDIYGAIDDLRSCEHSYKTLVIDGLSHLEQMIWEAMFERDSKGKQDRYANIEDYGWGRGYQRAVDEWRALFSELDRLRAETGMHVVLVGHSKLAKRKNPDSVDWDWYVPAVDHRAAGVIQQWADLVCLCVKEEGGQKSEGRGKGYSTGRRIMKTDGEATYMAKSRLDMPAEVELAAKNPAAPILEALRRMSPASTASMDELLGMVQGTEHKKRIATMLAGGPSQQQVDKSIEWIRSKA